MRRYNRSKSLGCSKSGPKGEIHHNTSIHSKTGKNSNTKANLTPKGAREKRRKKQQIDSTPSRRRELIKIRAELNEIETEELWNRSTEPGVSYLKELMR